MHTTSDARESLIADSRGAVMLIGLFMACFLIGSLWFIVGIGDAIVMRDTAQEAADAVAFSAATVHARGMNFIAALNLVMLAIVAVYIVMGMISDTLQLIAKVSDGICATAIIGDPLAIIACPVAAFAEPAAETATSVYETYQQAMKPVLMGLSWTQTGVAMLSPYGGEVAGIMVASQYKATGFSFSASMVPSFALSGGLFNGSYTKGGPPPTSTNPSFTAKGIDGRIGLPVVNQKMNKLCEYSAKYPLEFMEGWLSKLPLVGSILQLPGLKGLINGIIAGAIDLRYCNELLDGFWGRDGPKGMFGPANNGSDWMQVYGWILSENGVDPNASKVALAGYKFGLMSPPSDAPTYMAESEFYFDCKEKWDGDTCNGDINRAMYSMRWMVRLRRVHFPDIGADLLGWLGQVLGSANIVGPLKGKLANSDVFKNIQKKTTDIATKYAGGIGNFLAGTLFGSLVQQGNGPGMIDNGVSWVQGKIPGGVTPPLNGIIH